MKGQLALLCCISLLGAAYANDVATVDYLSAFEQEVVREHNLARTKPQQYIAFLEDYARVFSGKIHIGEGGVRLRTNEGAAAVEEAIAFMRRVRLVGPLKPALGMSAGAADHAADQARTGKTGHGGSDGSMHGVRVNRYGDWQTRSGENIYYGSGSARDVVIKLIVDDGVPSRGHRDNIFDPRFRIIGVGCNDHRTYGQTCVLTYAAGYKDRVSAERAARTANGHAGQGQAASSSPEKGALRTWTDIRGRRVQGRLQSASRTVVRLNTTEGKVISVPRRMLSKSDQAYLKSLGLNSRDR